MFRSPKYRRKSPVSLSLYEHMAINYEGLRSLTARELIAALKRDGFYFLRQTGSHQRFRHADGRRVTVAPHGSGDTFTLKTLKSMSERQARWNENDLIRLGVIKE
jgi:predicted RNA binding protein YcfA (HicA-like mRNA interferase family)